MKISELLTDINNGLYKLEQHKNLHDGEGKVTLIIPTGSDSASALEGFILLERDGDLYPSIGEHGHSDNTSEKYTVHYGSVEVNRRVFFKEETATVGPGEKHNLQLLGKIALVEFKKY